MKWFATHIDRDFQYGGYGNGKPRLYVSDNIYAHITPLIYRDGTLTVKDEWGDTFDLTTDSVRGMRDILIARGEHLVRLEALEEKTQAEYRDNASRIDEIKHAGYEAGMKKVYRSSKGYSHSYARRIAPNFAKKAGFKGDDAEYFVSGFIEAVTQ